MTEATVTRVYLRYVRVQLMSKRSATESPTPKTDQGISRCWDVYLGTSDGERIVRHSSASPEYNAARALQERGIKGIIEIWRRQPDGTEQLLSRVNVKKAASLATTRDASPRVEIVEDIGDTNSWPDIANPDDVAAFEAYCNSPEVVERAAKEKARKDSLRSKHAKPSD